MLDAPCNLLKRREGVRPLPVVVDKSFPEHQMEQREIGGAGKDEEPSKV